MEGRQQIARVRGSVLVLEAKGWPIYIDTIRLVYEESVKRKIPITDMVKASSLEQFSEVIEESLNKERRSGEMMHDIYTLHSS